jgi:hypothetical protein
MVIYKTAIDAFLLPALKLLYIVYPPNRQLYRVEQMLTKMPEISDSIIFILADLSSLLLFGIVHPFCAFVISVSVIVQALMLRYQIISHCTTDTFSNEKLQQYDQQCSRTMELGESLLYKALWVPSIFFSLFIADVYGDGSEVVYNGPLALIFVVLSTIFLFEHWVRISAYKTTAIEKIKRMSRQQSDRNTEVVRDTLSVEHISMSISEYGTPNPLSKINEHPILRSGTGIVSLELATMPAVVNNPNTEPVSRDSSIGVSERSQL